MNTTKILLPLDQIANEINVRLHKADVADDHRIAAGQLLLEAKERVDGGEVKDEDGERLSWGRWCAQNIKGRSSRDIRQVIALVKCEDPQAARETEKRRSREGMQSIREKRSNVTPVSQPEHVEYPAAPVTQRTFESTECNKVDPPSGLAAAKEIIKELSQEDFTELKVWFRAYCGA